MSRASRGGERSSQSFGSAQGVPADAQGKTVAAQGRTLPGAKTLSLQEQKQRAIEQERQQAEDLQWKLDIMSEGIQVFREYVRFDNYGKYFLEACYDKDAGRHGILKRDKFRDILRGGPERYYFTMRQIEEILDDAPKEPDNLQLIKYKMLYDAVDKAQRPRTSHSMINVCMMRTRYDYDLAKMFLEKLKVKNYFDECKENAFKEQESHYELGQLDIDMLRSDFESRYELELKEMQDRLNSNKRDDALKREILDKEQLTKQQRVNNETILWNLDILFSRDIVMAIKPRDSAWTSLQNEQVQTYLQQAILKKGNLDSSYLLLEDLERILHQDKYPFHKQPPLPELTHEEVSLIYYRIWKENNFQEFTVDTLSEFVIRHLHQKKRELMKKFVSEQEKRRHMVDTEVKVPRLFQELIKLAFQYGMSFIMHSFQPLQEQQKEKQHLVEVSNLKLFFSSMQVQYSDEDLNELKVYMSGRRVIVLDSYDSQKFLASNLYVDLNKLREVLLQETSGLMIAQEKAAKLMRRTEVQARNTFHSRIIKAVADRLKNKIMVYKDENDMVEELILRRIINEQFQEIQADDLDLVFERLKQSTEASKYHTQRRIQVSDFFSFILSGTIFEDQGEEIVDELEQDSEDQENAEDDEDGDQEVEKKIKPSQQRQREAELNKLAADGEGEQDIEQERTKARFNIPREGGFIYERPTQAFRVMKLDDRQVLKNLSELIQKKLMKEKTRQLMNEFERLDVACLELRKLCKEFDKKNTGVIKAGQLKQLLDEHLYELGQNQILYLEGMAKQIAAVKNDENKYDEDIEISYSYFAMHIHKFLSVERLLQTQQGDP